jgi:Flp pilus assembly protein TadG
VEFSLAVTIFIFILMAIFDLGRAIFMYNGVSQAAREIARTTSVHPGALTLGDSIDTAETVTAQQALVPGLQVPPTYQCVDGSGAPSTNDPCASGVDYVKVTVTASFRPITPIISFVGDVTLSASSSIRLPG